MMEADRLKQLIRDAGSAIPEPDTGRLATVYARIAPAAATKKRAPALRWWHWLLLAGAATAMASGYWYAQQTTQTTATEAMESVTTARQVPRTQPGLPENAPSENSGAKAKEDDNGTGNGATIIYRR